MQVTIFAAAAMPAPAGATITLPNKTHLYPTCSCTIAKWSMKTMNRTVCSGTASQYQ